MGRGDDWAETVTMQNRGKEGEVVRQQMTVGLMTPKSLPLFPPPPPSLSMAAPDLRLPLPHRGPVRGLRRQD